MPGGPIQQFADPRDSCLSPQLIAACHDLLRLSSRAIPQSGCSILLISTFPLSIYYLNTGTHCESSVGQRPTIEPCINLILKNWCVEIDECSGG